MTQLRWVKAVNDRITFLEKEKEGCKSAFKHTSTDEGKAVASNLNVAYGLEIDFLKTLLEEQTSEQGEEELKQAAVNYANNPVGVAHYGDAIKPIANAFIAGAKYILCKEVSAEGWIRCSEEMPDKNEYHNFSVMGCNTYGHFNESWNPEDVLWYKKPAYSQVMENRNEWILEALKVIIGNQHIIEMFLTTTETEEVRNKLIDTNIKLLSLIEKANKLL